MTKKKLTYQTAFNELQSIAAQLEGGEVDIDQITKMVKRSIELTKFCQEKLRTIESELNSED